MQLNNFPAQDILIQARGYWALNKTLGTVLSSKCPRTTVTYLDALLIQFILTLRSFTVQY